MTTTVSRAGSARAARALHGAGYTQLRQLAGVPAAELKKLHGMGQKALRVLQEALAEQGLSTPPAQTAEVPLIQQSVEAVEARIRPYIRLTPVITIDRAELGLPPGPLTLKLEQTQHSGSFKVRGAFTNLLLREIPNAGVAAASGGNHGAAVAYAAQVLGIPARIFVPEVSSPAKISRIRSYGADLVVEGATYSDALAVSQDWVAGSGALPIPAYDQPETILGEAPARPVRELRRQAAEATTILTAVGGGGLLAGIATAVMTGATASPLRVVGVEPEGAPTMTAALAAGGPADAPAGGIAVDSLRAAPGGRPHLRRRRPARAGRRWCSSPMTRSGRRRRCSGSDCASSPSPAGPRPSPR